MVTKKKTKFFKSLRFRILVILLILGIVPSAIVTQLMISNYEKQAIEVKVSEISTQCAILCNQIIKENYLNDSSSQSVNSKLELLSNVYGGSRNYQHNAPRPVRSDEALPRRKRKGCVP